MGIARRCAQRGLLLRQSRPKRHSLCLLWRRRSCDRPGHLCVERFAGFCSSWVIFMTDLWILSQDSFDPKKQHHQETIFTIGNGYLSTRGAFEEGYPDDRRATFIHGVFDKAPIVFTELANAPDWLPITIILNNDERFSLDSRTVESFNRALDLRTGLLTRMVRWRSPAGLTATLTFERFVSLADEHLLYLRCRVTPEFAGTIEFRMGLNGNM